MSRYVKLDDEVSQLWNPYEALLSPTSLPPCSRQVSKKRKFVADGVFNAELNEFLARTLGDLAHESSFVSEECGIYKIVDLAAYLYF